MLPRTSEAVEALGGTEARLLPHAAPRSGGRGSLAALGARTLVPRRAPTSALGSPYIDWSELSLEGGWDLLYYFSPSDLSVSSIYYIISGENLYYFSPFP